MTSCCPAQSGRQRKWYSPEPFGMQSVVRRRHGTEICSRAIYATPHCVVNLIQKSKRIGVNAADRS